MAFSQTRRAKTETPKREFVFATGGVDTQLIVGTVDDNDWLAQIVDDEGFLPNLDPNIATYHEMVHIPQIGQSQQGK